jgi:hypothetical protein
MLDVKVLANKVRVAIKGQDPLFEGEWNKKIKADETLWTVESEGKNKIL